MKLLYAEDELALSEAVVDYLTYHKYIVDAVYDGADAYDYAMSGKYDCNTAFYGKQKINDYIFLFL